MSKEVQQEKEDKRKLEDDLKYANEKIERMKKEVDCAITKHQDFEKDNFIMKEELGKEKNHIEKLHVSRNSIDKQLEKQKSKGDITGIGHRKVQETKSEK